MFYFTENPKGQTIGKVIYIFLKEPCFFFVYAFAELWLDESY
jgi:hypothetical protein